MLERVAGHDKRPAGSIAAKTRSEDNASASIENHIIATAEIKQRAERAMAVINDIEDKNMSPGIKADIEYMKKNLSQFEADGAVGALMVLARRAQRENQKLIIGLETDWLPGANIKGSRQRTAIALLVKEMNMMEKALRSMGLDNIEIVRGSGDELALSLATIAKDTGTHMRNIVVLASKDTVYSPGFKAFRTANKDNRPLLSGIDPAELFKLYEEHGEAAGEKFHIELTNLLYIALEIAAGKEPPSVSWIKYDNDASVWIFIPRAEKISYEELMKSHKAEVVALQAA